MNCCVQDSTWGEGGRREAAYLWDHPGGSRPAQRTTRSRIQRVRYPRVGSWRVWHQLSIQSSVLAAEGVRADSFRSQPAWRTLLRLWIRRWGLLPAVSYNRFRFEKITVSINVLKQDAEQEHANSASVSAVISVRSPRKLCNLVIYENIYSGQKYPKNM